MPLSTLVPPHGGGSLKPLMPDGAALEAARAKAAGLPRIPVSSREAGDIVMFGIGGFTPLEGFMTRADWAGVCERMETAGGLFWPIPITLSATEDDAAKAPVGSEVALYDPERDEVLAILSVTEHYGIDKAIECQRVFGTTDAAHPGVKMVLDQPPVNLAGRLTVLSLAGFPEQYGEMFLTPAQTRAEFARRNWQTVAAFQTRNPMHRSHEYLAKIAVEVCDGVLVHSLLGKLKAGDIPAPVRQEAIARLIENYFVKDTVLQAGYPLDMRYAGPREALLHALFRQNYGCSHLIVGRDHAGVGDYYGPFEAQTIFDTLPDGALQTKALKIDWTFWCNACEAMASAKTCPHDPAQRLLLSGTKLRKLLSEGDPVPDHFSRPEVLEVLRHYYEGLEEGQKVKVELTGHSAASQASR